MSTSYHNLRHIVYAFALCLLISACQSNQQESAPQSSPQKQISKQITNNEQKVLDQPEEQKERSTAPTKVNLNLSKELIEKIDSDSQQKLNLELHEKVSSKTAGNRKVKISAGVLVDKEEEDLTKKLDGGKVNISVPFN